MCNKVLNKVQALTKSMNMNIWVVGTLKQLIMRVFILKLNFQKNKEVRGKTLFFVIDTFRTSIPFVLNLIFCAIIAF